MRRHDWRMIIEAGHSISTYTARRWIGEIDVPTAIVCTTEDRGVAPNLQRALAETIPGATLHEIGDGHLACANARFAPPLVEACLDVASRAY
jgi:pimeloyl-ACP methyl ester carboxylesterase